MIHRPGKVIALFVLSLATLPAGAFAAAQSSCRLPARIEAAPCAKREASRGEAGDFDYYILSLSWSPAFCNSAAGRRHGTQCRDNRFGWVVHGLWPQYEKARGVTPPWPQYCASVAPLPAPLLRRHLCTLPDAQLMQCQWAKHGSCSGFSDPADYFAAIEALRSRFVLPEPSGSAADLSRAVAAANPGLRRSHVRVVRKDGRIAELRICLSRNLQQTVNCG
ncbi:hypothetical protein [uncultured Ferrovibrio sp.]|uniref:ribonuclease T2 family protein n=1 Tax=uncultured Ferrovibrio sp. TaxID=1576913 RepID=UPI002602482F|nr:hypothetical protein [uncultured Ferrovibrio sp.]